jgi:hypothetical protein
MRRAATAAPAGAPQMSDAELRSRAQAGGIDLDNPKVLKEMEGRAKARRQVNGHPANKHTH